MSSSQSDFHCNAHWAKELLDVDLSDFDAAAECLHAKWDTHTLVEGLRGITLGGPETRFSFLFAAKDGLHLLPRVLDQFDVSTRRELLTDFAFSNNLYIPYDLRAALFATLGTDSPDGPTRHRLEVAAAQEAPAYKDLARSPSNDIDHNFHIPADRAARDELVETAAQTAMRRTRARLARRALGAAERDPAAGDPLAPARIYVPRDAAAVFAATVLADGMDWRDFLVDWNEVLVETSEEAYTIAEILRLLLLDPDYHLPGHAQRARADAVHLNLLKAFCGATIGLKAGVLFVEHGFRPEASFFLLTENAILGKSCVVDATGVVLIEPKAFLGGGFSPILIHTHKHMRGGGADERKSVAPTGFRARSGSRLPMDFVGLLEVMDMPCDRWPGLERMEIEILDRAQVWPANDVPALSAPTAVKTQSAQSRV
jgi:hypothetical protein